MASPTDICNISLALVGSKSILDLSDESKRARLCKRLYPLLRDDMLRDHLWNFAINMGTLAEKTSAPLFGFSKCFSLPQDFLRLVGMEDRYVEYRLENGVIHSSESVLRIRYIKRIEDSEVFDSSFVMALAYRIAAELALPLADDNNLHNILLSKANKQASLARSIDAQENPATQIQADEWLDSRW